jgi:hypothetical protein
MFPVAFRSWDIFAAIDLHRFSMCVEGTIVKSPCKAGLINSPCWLSSFSEMSREMTERLS